MKKIHLYIAGAAVAMLATACSHEDIFDISGQGRLKLSATVNSDMKVVSRAVEQDLVDSCMIWISNEKGLVRRYNSMNDLPLEPIDLLVGHYVAEAWTGDSVPASWEARWFKGIQPFDIVAGQTTQVDLECKIANVGATVHYAEGIEEVLHDFTMTIGHEVDTLLYVGREVRRGYFMMPSFDKNLTYTLRGTQIDGSAFEYEGKIYNAKPGYEYALNVTYTQTSTEVGGALFTIVIDENVIEVNNEINLVTAPKIVGYGFDINAPFMGEKGTFDQTSVYVTSATKVTAVELNSDLFATLIPALGGSNFELLGMNEVGQNAVRTAGITYKYDYNDELDQTLLKISFSEQLMNSLDNGEYAIDFKATDVNGRTSTATLNIIVSDAPVVTSPIETTTVSYFNATLRGTASKADVSNIGFKYHQVGDPTWETVEGHFTNGLEFAAEVTGLKDNAKYEYVAVSGSYESPIKYTFITLSAQLPNCGFEEWSNYNNAVIPGASFSSTFWDTGNHGSKTMQNKQVTTQSTTIKHSGNSAACLKSQFVGMFNIGKFAAGNIFAGNYLYTDGMDGVLGWGRPWTLSPKSVKAWIKYEPGKSVNKQGAGDYVPVGTDDQGIIYMALVDDTKTTYTGSVDDSSLKNTAWPCIVKTKSGELFDKDGANVIAYGEYIIEKATDGAGMVQIEIPLNYKKPGVTPSNIIFVASASRYGDYFQGGEGSTLYLDDIELVY